MLNFFRRFQKIIFIAITTVIVISFSFFGTFSLFDKQVRDEVVFTAVDGQEVKRSEVDALSQFLATDALDQMNWGTPLGANFLNDGVIRNDFLKNGLGKVLFDNYYPELKNDWEGKWKREKGFQAYRHPEVAYFSADAVWSHFAPHLKEAFKEYKNSSSENPSDQFVKKANLYLAEGEFSELQLKQVLYFQMQQAKWIKTDKSLQHQNLSLFGYKNLNDWFGNDFLRLAASFILNSAKVATREGYKVTRDEALFDLKKRALNAFETQKQNPLMTYTDPGQYLREQLRYLGMDLGQAVEVWQQVLLFRKMFSDLGSSVLVDKETFAPYIDYVSKQVDVTTYHLPKEVQIKDFRQFQRFETYLRALSKEQGETLPTKWKREDEIAESAPELLMKRYLVEIKEVDNKSIGQKIGLKQLWQWQVSDAGWEKLSSEYSTLAQSNATNEEERFSVLDGLDEVTKQGVDQKSRLWIAEGHPEWIEEAIASAPYEKKTLIFYKKSSKNPLKGLTQPEKAIAMLDQPSLEEENLPVVNLRDVGEKTWTVKIYDRSPTWEIATFAEAEKDGVLEEMVLNKLQDRYEDLKTTSPNLQASDGSYKPLREVRDFVAQEIFRKEINKVKRAMPPQESQAIDLISTYRFKNHLEAAKIALLTNPENESEWIQKTLSNMEDKLPARSDLADQFKLVKEEIVIDRTQNPFGQTFAAILAVDPAKTSDVIHRQNGEMLFYRVNGTKSQARDELFVNMIAQTKNNIANELQKTLANRLLQEFKEKESIKIIPLARKS